METAVSGRVTVCVQYLTIMKFKDRFVISKGHPYFS